MSVTTWLDATIASVVPFGTITHHVATTSVGQKSVICWQYGSRSVFLGESSNIGRKRAMYEVLNNGRIIATIRKLEAEAERDANVKALAEIAYVIEAAEALGIDVSDNDGEAFEPSADDERMAALAAQG